MNETNEIKSRDYLIYVIVAVLVLIILTVAGTYAYFKADVTNPSRVGSIDATLECISIDYSEEYNSNTVTEGEILKLNYNYPIKDEFAIENVVPITISVTNRCTENTTELDYTLAITSLANETGYINDNQIRMFVKKQLKDSPETTLHTSNYLSNLNLISEGNTYTYLTEDLNSRESIASYPSKTSYIIDSNTIGNLDTHIFKVYLWIDYYEGDFKMYDPTTYPNHNHEVCESCCSADNVEACWADKDGCETCEQCYDNTTEEKNFAAAISLVVNP